MVRKNLRNTPHLPVLALPAQAPRMKRNSKAKERTKR